jgi:hypothetical protein
MNDKMELAFQIQRASPQEILNSDALLEAYLQAFEKIENPMLKSEGPPGVFHLEYIFGEYRKYQPKKLTNELLRSWLKEQNTAKIFEKRETFFEVHPDLEDLGIICFSKDPDSIPMWGHYAKNGYCLEYEFDENKKINTKYSTEHVKGCFWYNLKLRDEWNDPAEGDVYFWVEKENLTCRIKGLNGVIETITLNFKLKDEELTPRYLDYHYKGIIQELTDKGLIYRIGKGIIYPNDNGLNQIITLTEVKYEEKIPVLKEKKYFNLLSKYNNEEETKEKLKKQMEWFMYAGEHSFYVKSHDWGYEKEFRLISNINSKDIEGEYQPLNENFPLRLNGIIIGENLGADISDKKDKNAAMLKEYVFQKAKSKQLVVYFSERDLDSGSYRMKHTKLE